MSQVITASEDAPYLAFFLKLDISTVRDVVNTEEVHVTETSSGARGMAIGETTVELVNACSRLMDLLDALQDIPFFGKLIQREIIYRLLQGTQGQRLRAMATLGDQSHRTAKAIAWLRANYQKPLRVEQLATVAGMSRSTLHHHFRALTAMSPLQFQKQLIASTSVSLASPQFAISRPCERQSRGDHCRLTLNCSVVQGAACSQLSQTAQCTH